MNEVSGDGEGTIRRFTCCFVFGHSAVEITDLPFKRYKFSVYPKYSRANYDLYCIPRAVRLVDKIRAKWYNQIVGEISR